MGLDINRVQQVLLAAVDAPDLTTRWAVLDRECGDDAELRQRVITLLSAHDGAGSLLERVADAAKRIGDGVPIDDVATTPESIDETKFSIPLACSGSTINGRYRLLQQIGEGGMGTVWMAEQSEPVRRLVAVKLIKPEVASKRAVIRFAAERQALALMNHPNIATVFDGGTTADGCPFFAMELVRGTPLTEYCDGRRLPIRDRLKLMIQVCDAVQHAHQKGILHRDIKPTNILVTEQNGRPIPKVIDFGLAKAFQEGQPLTEHTLFTVFGGMMGTPLYMAPEQIATNALDVDTRADIYALGAILFELLTGSTPIERQILKEMPWDEICSMIRNEDAPRPSTRVSTSAISADIAARRGTSPEKLAKTLRRDLDWIALKALEKDRSRRYDTADGLGADLERYLKSEPILARHPGGLYRFQKLVNRNKLAFGAASVVVAALVLGLGASTWLLVKEREAHRRAVAAEQEQMAARNQAQLEAARSKLVAEFLKDMLKGVHPEVALGRDTHLLRDILDQTASRLNELSVYPEVETDLRATLGKVYLDIGEYKRAEAMHDAALALRKSVLGMDHKDVAQSTNDLAEVYYGQGRYADSEKLYRSALAIRKRLFGEDSLEVADSLSGLAEAIRRSRQQDKYAEAEAMHRRALAVREQQLGTEHADVADSLNNLGLLLWAQGVPGRETYHEAESLHRRALAMRKELFGAEHPDVAVSLDRLGLVLYWQGRSNEAEAVHREALAMRKRLFGSEHPDVAHSLINLTSSLQFQGKWDQADSLLREALSIRRKLLGKGHPDLAGTLNLVAWNLVAYSDPKSYDPQQALLLAKEAIDIAPHEGSYWNTLGVSRYRAGEFDAALFDLQRSISLKKGNNTAFDAFFLAMIYKQLGTDEVALEWYEKALHSMNKNSTKDQRPRCVQMEAQDLLGVSGDGTSKLD